jgi:hypothetical protein
MLLTKVARLTESVAGSVTDGVTATVATHLPGTLARPVNAAVSTLTWLPRHAAGGSTRSSRREEPTASESSPGPAATSATTHTPSEAAPSEAAPSDDATAPEPQVVLTLDRPAEDVEPPIDVVGEALRAESPAPVPPLEDEGHVEVQDEVVYSTSSDQS